MYILLYIWNANIYVLLLAQLCVYVGGGRGGEWYVYKVGLICLVEL